MDVSRLRAYHGYQSSIIPLSSQYYLYFTSWDSTPTDYPTFANLWLITPEDHRILFADPPATREIACIYHEFDETHGASIGLDWASENHLRLQCRSQNGEYTLGAEFDLQETLAARVLLALASSPPTPLRVSKPMVRIADSLLNLFVTKGGATIVGRTETGHDWYIGASDRVMNVTWGLVTLNGENLGDVSSPTWQPAFGDFHPYGQPVIRLGTLYIPYGEQPGSAAGRSR